MPDEPTERFAANLRRIREKRDLSQGALADLAEMHPTEVSSLERANREPRLGTLLKLSAVLEVPLREFFEGIEWQPPTTQASLPVGRFWTSPAALSRVARHQI